MKSAWGPLLQPLFRSLWLASVVSNIGTWMQNVGGVWLMTNLTTSPLLIALMQVATSLPVFLFAMPAGALADIVDRRRMLIIAQVWMLVAALLLGVLTLYGMTTPFLLLGLTFFLGIGNAMNAPVWQAAVPEIASREQLSEAVALNGVGYNIARVIGPSLGGLAVAAMGTAANFFLNALSFLGVIIVIYRWKRQPSESALPAERLIGAVRAGLRYVSHAPVLQAILVRAVGFTLFSSAIWALLPIVVKEDLDMGSEGYGLLLGCLGAGSLFGAMMLPRLTNRFSLDRRLIYASIVFGAATFALAFVHNLLFLCFMMVLAGCSWLVAIVGINVATQSVAPVWVQARALALYALTTQGGLAIGSTTWGVVATHTSHSTALAAAGVGLFLSIAAVFRWPLAKVHSFDLTPSAQWPESMANWKMHPDEGPVLVEIEYLIDPSKVEEFKRAAQLAHQIRRRDGAIRWELYHDVEVAGRYIEIFAVESWGEHLRQHARITRSDRDLLASVDAFHIGDKPPIVTHLIYASTKPAGHKLLRP